MQRRNVRVLVCGGRTYGEYPSGMRPGTDPEEDTRVRRERAALTAALDKLHRLRSIRCVIEGEARGADRLGRDWAEAHGVPFEPYPADWTRFGRSAGFRRNTQMLEEGQPDCVVAFPGGKGTTQMIRIAREAGVPVWEPLAETSACTSM